MALGDEQTSDVVLAEGSRRENEIGNFGKRWTEGTHKRPLYRQAHLKRLGSMGKQGKMILAGPLTDKTGSLIVVEAESLEEAQAFAKDDPYTIHGVFQEVTVHPFLQVFPKNRFPTTRKQSQEGGLERNDNPEKNLRKLLPWVD